jgi:hypothetical protein
MLRSREATHRGLQAASAVIFDGCGRRLGRLNLPSDRDREASRYRIGQRVLGSEGESHANRYQHQSGRAPESVNHELIFPQISPLRHSATQSMTSASHEKCGCTQMPNSNDVANSKMLWERVLSLLVVGASVLGGSAVLLIQALPPILHGFP